MFALVKSHRHVLATLILLWHFTASAQLTANFSATPVSGCSPLIVNFSDLSTGNPTQWKWDLGNGVISTLKNPSATYFNAGTYNIKLVVRNAAGADSIIRNQYITVHGNPIAGFTASDTTGCFPLPVQFTDQSTPGSGSISSWQWDFGDGSLSSQQSPFHVYTSSGNNTVTLKVTNSFGCVKTLSKVQHIQVSDGVTAGFTNSSPGVCSAPADIQFTNTSTGPGVMSYMWDFGDGNTSTATNPSHIYTTNGSYTVFLVAVSAQGCRDTIKKQNLISIGVNQSNFSVPDSVCLHQPISFTNSSSPLPSSAFWNFGDGSFSSSIHPTKTYTSSGTYTVKLVNNFGACSDSISKQIVVVPPPQVNFTSNITAGCQLPTIVNFQSQNPGNYSLLWIFGDGTTSTQTNPVHAYTTEGNFTVQLIATNSTGCSDTVTKTDLIKIQKPNIQLTGLPKGGCVPVSIQPTATIAPGQTIQGYLWNFGDGTTSNLAKPSHTYSTSGTYTVSLTIATTTGCIDSIVMVNAVRAGEKPHANFSLTPIDDCAMHPIHFTDKSTGNVDQWHWIFGDGYFSDEQNPIHEYSDTGWIVVQLVAYNNSCPDTIVVDHAVHIRPPISAFTTTKDCNNKFKADFKDLSLGATTWSWTFGDGATSTQQNPSHTYAAPGIYLAGLSVTNGNCSHYSERLVKVINEKADFHVDSLTCKNTPLEFTAVNINAANVAFWSWDFGDGTSSGVPSTVTHTYAAAGFYTITLTVTDILGCSDVKTKQVHVLGPTAGFTSSASAVCLNNNLVSFADASVTDGTHGIVQRIWNYGDGVIDTLNLPPFQHHYQLPGTYDVSLTVTDDNGCSDMSTKPAGIIISKPVANFFATDTISCTDKAIAFTNTSSAIGGVYDWSFGDGTQSSDQDPLHNYASIGTYSITLHVTDQYGCKDSLSKPDYISISYPKAGFTMSDSFGTCPPLIVNFTNNSTDYTTALWDFGDGTFSSLKDPSHFYNSPGTFYPKLIVTGPGGCTDTFSRKIVVKGPNGSFTYQPLSGCTPLTVNFTATTQNTSSFVWDFSDGTTLSTTDSVVSHTYATPGDFIPKMILTDAGGCNYPITGPDTIRAYAATAGFKMNTNKLCNTGTIQFTNTTLSNDLISGYQWDFGDGGTSSSMNPSHQYLNLGTYTVQLIATTQNGCKDTVILSDTIMVLQKPDISISGDTSACIPALFTFKGIVHVGNAATMKWDWDLGNGQTSNQQNPSPQTYNTAGNFPVSAIVTADNGCKDTTTHDIELFPLPSTNAGADVAICRGSITQLNATGATTYVWNNSSLSCTNCAAPLAGPSDSTVYVVTGYNSFGCSSSDSVVVSVHQPFVLSVGPGDTICVGSSAHLSATGADIYSWSPSASLSSPDNATTTAKPQTSTTYQVVAKDRHNCFADTASVFIKVWPLPTVDAGADLNIVVGNSIQLQPVYSTDVTSWQWNNAGSLSCFNCPAPDAKPKQTTSYTVQAKNDGGCTATDQVNIFVTCNNGNLLIPNTFSPNGDGVNDRFYPNGKGINMIRSLRVYNRWGEIVFERSNFVANDPAMGWDGTYKGKLLAPDVYVYTCDVVCQNNEVLTYKGDLTLLR